MSESNSKESDNSLNNKKSKFGLTAKVKHSLLNGPKTAAEIANIIVTDFPEDVAQKEALKKSDIPIVEQITAEVGATNALLAKNGVKRRQKNNIWEYYLDSSNTSTNESVPINLPVSQELDNTNLKERAMQELNGPEYKLLNQIAINPGKTIAELEILEELSERQVVRLVKSLINKGFVNSSHKIWTKTTITIKEDQSSPVEEIPKLRVKELYELKKDRLEKEGKTFTLYEFAKEMGIDNEVTAKTNGPKFMSPNYNPSFQNMVRLAKVLGVEVADLYEQSNTNPDTMAGAQVEDVPLLRIKELYELKKTRLEKEGNTFTWQDFATAIGMKKPSSTRSGISKILKEDYNPTFNNMVKIAKALDVEVVELFVKNNSPISPEKPLESSQMDLENTQSDIEGRMVDIGNQIIVESNIVFSFGNPNTGKSYGYSSKQLQLKGINKINYWYEKIPVSGGIGNEFKGLQSSDLAIGFDSVTKQSKSGLFLQILKNAILNPGIPHVVFLDDAHNQNLSSLLSEYTPVFKQGERVTSSQIKKALGENFDPVAVLKDLKKFNQVIEKIRKEAPQAGEAKILNRIDSEGDVELIFPDNFYLLVAGNYNRYTTQVFADWQDRASVKHLHSLIVDSKKLSSRQNIYNRINENLRTTLVSHKIFDFEKYTFGIFKIEEQSDEFLLPFVFSMIKNSLVEHGNSHKVNMIGLDLIRKLITLDKNPFIIYKDGQGRIKGTFGESKGDGVKFNESNQEEILHAFNIYRQED